MRFWQLIRSQIVQALTFPMRVAGLLLALWKFTGFIEFGAVLLESPTSRSPARSPNPKAKKSFPRTFSDIWHKVSIWTAAYQYYAVDLMFRLQARICIYTEDLFGFWKMCPTKWKNERKRVIEHRLCTISDCLWQQWIRRFNKVFNYWGWDYERKILIPSHQDSDDTNPQLIKLDFDGWTPAMTVRWYHLFDWWKTARNAVSLESSSLCWPLFFLFWQNSISGRFTRTKLRRLT